MFGRPTLLYVNFFPAQNANRGMQVRCLLANWPHRFQGKERLCLPLHFETLASSLL